MKITLSGLERLKRHGYRCIHLFGNVYLVRNYSMNARRFSLYGIIYACPNANCRTPIYTGKCSKICSERYKKEIGIKPQTNADRIRAMSDEELAWELMTWRMETEAKHHGVESNYPNTQAKILEWLKQPAEKVNEQWNTGNTKQSTN